MNQEYDHIELKNYALKKLCQLIVAFYFLIAYSCSEIIKKEEFTYFISSSEGSDANDGLTSKSAWKTLEKANATILKPGHKLLFKSGDIWIGQLEVTSSGTHDSLILIDKYGVGNKPVIEGMGEKRHTLLLKNISYCTVRNLEITNTGHKRKAKRTGVLIQSINFGEAKNITLDSLEVHHVNGSLVKKEGGGSAVFWENNGDSLKSRFVNLKIQNSFFHHTERNGIMSKGYADRNKWYPSLGVVIRNNVLEQIPGDGIVPIGTDGALIELNTMRDSPDILSHEEAAAGIWPWSSDNTIIQFNEVSGHKARWDGQGFDSDYNCKNTRIQYNYSHDNYGGFLLICNDGGSLGKGYNQGTTNSLILYNISINDGIRPYPTERKGWFSPVMHITGPVMNSKISNNLFIIPPKTANLTDKTIIKMDNWGNKWPSKTLFTENIFYSQTSAEFSFKGDQETVFENNKISAKIPLTSYQKFSDKNKIHKTNFNIEELKKDLEKNNNKVSKVLIEKWLEKATHQ
jgi:hypothetical protein